MKHLSELRKRLRDAESAYKVADSSLDSSPLEVIVCKEELNQVRFLYRKACEQHIEELYFSEDEV